MSDPFTLAGLNKTACMRCGALCVGKEGSPEAQLLKHAKEGLCVNCGVTQFLQAEEFPMRRLLTELPDAGSTAEWDKPEGALTEKGEEMLRSKPVQEQFARIMAAGKADAQPLEIDWERVIAQWNRPFSKIARRASR